MSKFNSVWSFGTSFTAENIVDALNECDLDFEVQKSPLLATTPNTIVPKMVGTFRTDTGAVLGVVGKDYGIVNNRDAFEFADLIENLTWETGGYTEAGLAFLVGRLPDRTINNEEYIPYIVFQNSFNGRWNLKGQILLRDKAHGYIVNLPFASDIKIRHSSRAEDRVRLAKQALLAVDKYIGDFAAEAASLSGITISDAALEVVVSDLFPIKTGDSDRVRDNQLAKREDFIASYSEDQTWWGTGWGVIKAFADFSAKCNSKLASKNRRRAETVLENTLISGKNYKKLIAKLESL